MNTTRRHGQLRNLFHQHPENIPLFREYERTLLRAKKTKLQWDFLNNCLQDKIIPRSLLTKSLSESSDVPFNSVHNCILKEHVEKAKREVNTLLYKVRRARRNLHENCDDIVAQHAVSVIERSVQYKIFYHSEHLKRKLSRNFMNSLWVKGSNPDKNILNISLYQLTDDEKFALDMV